MATREHRNKSLDSVACAIVTVSDSRTPETDRSGALIRQRLISVGHEVQISEPKTLRGKRRVALDERTVDVLKAHRRTQIEDRLGWGPSWDETGFLFTREDGTPIHPDQFTKLFARAVKESGVPRIRLHDLRHTRQVMFNLFCYTSLLVKQSENLI